MRKPKISIITASYNSDKYIKNLIDSIAIQDYGNVEFIVIDGKSKDNTREILNQYSSVINYWISEPDKGIYDAWNKGLKKATGDWIMFLGSDDILLPDALNNYSKFIANLRGPAEYISSQLEMIDKNMKPIRIKGWPWEWPGFLKEVMVAHPGSLHSRKLFDKYGNFDTNYKIVGDYELLLRPKGELKTAFMPIITVKMQEGGASDSVAAIKEHFKASTTTGGYSKHLALLNLIIVYLKFKLKNFFRSFGFNLYLKHS